MTNLIVILVLAFCTPQTQQVDVNLVNTVLENSALIRMKVWRLNTETRKIQYGLGGCSGTFIGPNTVLTAAHCVNDPEHILNIWVRPYTTKAVSGYTAKLIKVDYTKDLALLALEGYQTEKYAKKASAVRKGEAVISVGSPYRFEYLLSEGIVAALGIKVDGFTSLYMIHTGMINPGSSGGGAFNSDGELIGVNTVTFGGFMGWAGISGAVLINDIREFLQ